MNIRIVWRYFLSMCSDDVPTIAALVDRADDKLFKSILHDAHHILNNLMPDETACSYRN